MPGLARNRGSAAPAAAGNLDFLGVTLQPGKTVQADVKLPPAAAKETVDYYGKESTMMKVAVAVPEGFDPSKPQRLLIASASTSGAGLSIKSMGAYTETALARGWMVMATEGEFGKPGPGKDNTYFRSNMTEVLMDLIAARWPKAKATWSVAFGGISGGAGYASFLATVAQGFLPTQGMASLYVEISPGIEINRVTDIALKSNQVKPGMQVVERVFGMLRIGRRH